MTAISELYRRHTEILARFDTQAGEVSPGAVEALDRELEALEAQIDALPCEGAADFAAKAAIATAQGQLALEWETDPLWVEARTLLQGEAEND